MQSKKFISPGAWFEMHYPAQWAEFGDGEESFLFYNPDVWTGNFRISVFKGEAGYGQESVQLELTENSSATTVRIGTTEAAYSQIMFEEEGTYYTTHLWVLGMENITIECSFTVPKGGSIQEAEAIIATLAIRHEGEKYPAELIPVRLAEIYQINAAYDWITELVKDDLKKDFQGTEEDLEHIQQIVDSGTIGPKKRDEWLAIGLTVGTILVNEVEGMEWQTLIDGNREAAVLRYQGRTIDPMKLVWSRVKAGQPVNVLEAYQSALAGDAGNNH
ncbi:MAG: DUF3805 domain-containing protein [Mediterranea sp.]|nr:DUF3805 domain-containing protein [Mediterranea sp.]